MKKQKRNNANGITLIALVISIIVMLILAGVSINAVVGDNGILTQAQYATVKQSCAALQEYLELYYAANFQDMDETSTRIQALMNFSESKNWFWRPVAHGYGTQNYVVNSNGRVCYLIDKENLPEDIKSQLRGGDAGSKSYKDYYTMNDVYGVTENLTVYYCASANSSIVGLESGELPEEDLGKEIFAAGSELGVAITGSDGQNVTFEELKTISELKIDQNSPITSFKDFYNLQQLTKLVVENVEITTLDGIEEAYQLKQIYFKNCKIGDYSALNKMQKRLTHLYCYLPPSFANAQSEVDTFLSSNKGIQNGAFEKLIAFGIFGNTQYIDNKSFSWSSRHTKNSVTDLSALDNLNDVTKKSITTLLLNANSVTDLSCLKDFENVRRLAIASTNITTLNGLQNMNNLDQLMADNNDNLGINESTTAKDPNTDALSYIRYNSTPGITVFFENCSNLKYAGYLENVNVKSAYLGHCSNLDIDDLSLLTNHYLEHFVSINANQAVAFNNNIRLDCYNTGNLTNADLKTKIGSKPEELQYLRLDGQTSLTDTVASGDTLNDILSTCTGLKTLSLVGVTGLTSINFVSNMPNLIELDLRNCTGVTDLSKLETQTNAGNLNLETLRINNSAIQINTIQNTISNLDGVWTQIIDGEEKEVAHNVVSFVGGDASKFFVANDAIYNQLGECKNITSLQFQYCGPGTIDMSGMDSLKKIQTYGGSGTWTLPNSLEEASIAYGRKLIELNTGSKLKTFTGACSGLSADDLKSYFQELSKCSQLETVNLALRDSSVDEVDFSTFINHNVSTLNMYKSTKATLKNIKGLGNNLRGLTTLKIDNFNELRTISGLKDLPQVTELQITHSQLADLTEIGQMLTLQKLSLYNNSIAALKPLENLISLKYLNLENNNIGDKSQFIAEDGTRTQYYNLDILAGLNRKALTQLLLKGNKGIIDDSKVSSLAWPDGYSFVEQEETINVWW